MPGTRLLRLLAVSVVGVLGATVAVVTVGAGIADAASHNHVSGHGHRPKPRLHGAAVSETHLGEVGGTVVVSADTSATHRCSLVVHPAINHAPPVKACTGRHVHWTARLPKNSTAAPVDYRFTITAVGAQQRPAPARHQSVTVAATAAPPVITGVTPNRSSFEYVGGHTTVVATISHGLHCSLTITPALPNPPPDSPCTKPKSRWPLTIPGNSSTAPVTYTLSLAVTGSHHQQTSALSTITVAAHPPPCPGQTSTAPPVTAAYFNDPTTAVAADQTRVVDAEINLICAAQPPTRTSATRITLGIYIYQLPQITEALLWAHHYEGATVHVLLDGANSLEYDASNTIVNNQTYDDLLAGLPEHSVLLCGPKAGAAPPPPDDPDDDGGNFPAGTGCAGNNIMHTKLLIVSSVDAAHDPAVFTSSQNLGLKAVTAAMNNGLQIVGDRALFNLDANYFTQIAQDLPQPNVGAGFSAAPVPDAGGSTTSTFFPQNVPASFPTTDKYHASNDEPTDMAGRLLRTVDCQNPGAEAGSHVGGVPRTTIRIAMSAYNKRPQVTDELSALELAGCDVQVVYSIMSAGTVSDLEAAGITPVQLDDPAFPYSDGSGSGLIFVHDKYLLISGGVKSGATTTTNQQIVLTGSANLTQRSLHQNDESSLVFQQTAGTTPTPVFDAYAANWIHLAALAASATP